MPFFDIGAGQRRADQRGLHRLHGALRLRHRGARQRHRPPPIVKHGGKTWFFLTADYAFGTRCEPTASKVVEGQRRHSTSARCACRSAPSDFSSFLLQAQASKAQILGLANAGGDTINSIKAANEFGITKTMKLAALLVFITDIHSLGLQTDAGPVPDHRLVLGPERRRRAPSAKRFFDKIKRMPTMASRRPTTRPRSPT